jgi:hypothetical protein
MRDQEENMTDIVLKHMELNENYHQVKENLAWLATSLYLVFSVEVIKWLHAGPLVGQDSVLACVMLGTLYLGVLSCAKQPP